MSPLPSLDLHAHVEPSIDSSELVALNSVVFAVTRSLDEARLAVRRKDSATIWGVGCHPGLALAQKAFSAATFSELLDDTALVGEVGLDGKSRVPMKTQIATLRSMLRVLEQKHRIMTVHSYAACNEVLELLAESKLSGVVLHWWLGTPTQTANAIRLGCYFSVNPAMLRHRHRMINIPIERVLTETDHPFGDRAVGYSHRPGDVTRVEDALAALHGISSKEVRLHAWRNLRSLVGATAVGKLLPSAVRAHLAAV